MMSNKNKSVQVLTKGVEFLFKKNKVTYIRGKGVLFSKNDVVVYDNNKKTTYKSKNIVIATGSEVSLAVNVAVRIRGDGIIAKVISMPSTSIFEKQSKTFKNNLLKSKSSETFVIEAGSTMYWNKYTKYENIFGLDNFGASAPGDEVFRKFGLTTETVSSKITRKIRTK